MNFKPELAAQVMAGAKTVTRRLASDNPRSPWWREQCALKPGKDVAIQPGRGKPAMGRATVVSVRLERLGDIDGREAEREGFADLAEFVCAFTAINGRYIADALVWRVELKAMIEDA
jgi:hypothetical protein